jgi:hypothetical protein
MLLDLLPQLRILLNADLLRLVVDELVQAAEIHVLGQQGDNVLVESLPVRVFEVVLLALFGFGVSDRDDIEGVFEGAVDGIGRETRYEMLCLEEIEKTYALMSITLDNRESARVLGILHDKPIFHISHLLSPFSFVSSPFSLLPIPWK